MNKLRILLVAAAITLVATLTTALAMEDRVTTNSFDATSTSSNINVSCRDVGATEISLVGSCNRMSNGEVELIAFASQISNLIACIENPDDQGDPLILVFTDNGNSEGITLSEPAVSLSSNGQQYEFNAVCSDGTTTEERSIQLSGGVVNKDGVFSALS